MHDSKLHEQIETDEYDRMTLNCRRILAVMSKRRNPCWQGRIFKDLINEYNIKDNRSEVAEFVFDMIYLEGMGYIRSYNLSDYGEPVYQLR